MRQLAQVFSGTGRYDNDGRIRVQDPHGAEQRPGQRFSGHVCVGDDRSDASAEGSHHANGHSKRACRVHGETQA
jgi:hypothetical protein